MDLNIQRQGDCIVVTLPSSLCFYEQRAAGVVQELGQLAEELHRQPRPLTRGVLILQHRAANDCQSSWADELRNDCLFNDLAQRVDTWRWLLSLIRNAPVPWVYAAADSCLGSAWELALSCQRRYWYSSSAELGFPEIAAGAFPPGGVLESLSKRAGRSKERWQAQPLFTASEAFADGLIDFCSDARDWLTRAVMMFQDMLRVSPSSGVRELRQQRGRDIQAKVDQQSSRTAFEQMETVWRHERAGTATLPLAWDYCWQLIKERGRLKQVTDLGRLICLISSQYLLSNNYILWLKSSLVQAHGADPLAEAGGMLPPVVIDLAEVAPPTAVLLRLLRGAVPVVFAAGDSRELMVAMNLLFTRLERSVGLAKAYDLWDPSVTWYQGPCDPARGVVLKWTLDDAFHVLQGTDQWHFLRFEGNAGSALPGAVEWLHAPEERLPPLVQSILVQATDAVIHVDQRLLALPASVHIRSLFLQELVRVSGHTEGDLGVLVGQLKAAGWGFASDDEAWDRFLRTRLEAYRFDGEVLLLGPFALARGSWEITSWKHAKAVAKRTSAGVRWNTTALSQHLALYLGLLAEALAHSQRVANPEVADFLCKSALGLPISFASPLTFLRLRGRRRVEHDASVHWPRVPVNGLVDGPSL